MTTTTPKAPGQLAYEAHGQNPCLFERLLPPERERWARVERTVGESVLRKLWWLLFGQEASFGNPYPPPPPPPPPPAAPEPSRPTE